MSFKDYRVARERMVHEQLVGGGISDPKVLDAMLAVPRHLFLDHDAGSEAYSNHAFPIGHSQTMSQPYMVAYLAEHLELAGSERVLEIGTGSGYQAAVLARLARGVFSIERIADLSQKAKSIMHKLRIMSVHIKIGDGALGWPQHAPFDRILLTAAASEVPERLLAQLRDGGFLLGPVMGSGGEQHIVKLTRRGSSFHLEKLKDCSFVPLVRDTTGRDQNPPLTPNYS